MSSELVMNRFRLLERIGSGGMGTVYRAFDERLQREVAVKEIALAGRERILREAQAAARLNHPAVVTLYELGERNGHALLVSELVRGRTVAELRRDGTLSDRAVAEYGADVCDALAHAHAKGVIHRDVKPENVIVADPDGPGARAKLMDFGIASVAGAPTLTADGAVLGTLAYMAPEQAAGEPCGEEADVYSLALTLYEAWSGTNPVAGSNPAQTARRIGRRQPSLADGRSDLPTALVTQIDACLEPEPAERPLLGDLQRALADAIPALDPEAAVPHDAIPAERPALARGLSSVLALTACATALAVLAGPAGRPGLALVLAALLTPGLLVARRAEVVALVFLAPLAAAFGALLVVPALLATALEDVRERVVLGASAFATYVVAALTLGAGPRLGLGPAAPDGWSSSIGTAANGVLAPLADPAALAGIALFAAAAAGLGWLLERSLPVALLGAAAWAACMETALATLGNGGLGEHPGLALGTAGVALAIEWRRRERDAEPRPRRLASARPALHGGGEAALLP